MQGFLSKIGKTASSTVSKAGSKASELAEVSKVKSRISSLRSDIGLARRDLGERCEQLFADGKIDDETVRSLCVKIDEYKDEIEALEQKIEVIKAEYQEKRNAQNDDDVLF